MLLTTCLLLAPLAQEPSAPRLLLDLRCEGVDSLLIDDKDAALLVALKMFDDRLLELPGELDDFGIPPQALVLATRLFSGGAHSLSVAISQEPIPGMPMPFLVDLRLAQGSDEGSRRVTADSAAFLTQMGMELSPPPAGALYVLPVPVPMWMGARGDDFVVRIGSDAGVEAPARPDLIPDAMRPSISGSLDYGAMLEQAVRMAEMSGEGGEELDELVNLLAGFGLDELHYEWAAGSDAERQLFVLRMRGWAAKAHELGMMPEHDLGEPFLRAIPEDATWASAAAFDLDGIFGFYEELLATYGVDVTAELEAQLGVDLRADLLEPLGGRVAIYASDTTGGGGLFSTVGVLELADRAKFLETWQRLEDAVDRMGAEEAAGYVRFESWGSESASFHTLTFPGLPIPLELTLATLEHHAVVGLSPQAVMAALDQIASPRRSLLDNPGFEAQRGTSSEALVGLMWIDTPRLMRDGYGTLGLATSAIANAMRSPSEPNRTPGMLLPTYNDLARGAKPILGLSYVRGDDYVSEYRVDRSHLVNAAGVTGFVYNSPMLALVGLAASGATAVQQNVAVRQQIAEQGKVEADLAAIRAALEHYALNNGGRYPSSLEELVTPDANGATYLKQRTVPTDPWGEPYGYFPAVEQGEEPYVFSRSLEEWYDEELEEEWEFELQEEPPHEDHRHEED